MNNFLASSGNLLQSCPLIVVEPGRQPKAAHGSIHVPAASVYVQSDLHITSGRSAGQRTQKGATQIRMPPCIAGQLVGSGHCFRQCVTELSDQLRPISSHAKLDDLAGILTAVDGTLINALPKMTWALWKNQHNAIKAHTQFDIEKHVPIKITITQANAGEIEVLAQNLEPGRIYVKDRGYAGLALFQQILEAGSSFVCRVKENSVYECLQDYELTPDEALCVSACQAL